jgi:UDP-glucose 4-epimerase
MEAALPLAMDKIRAGMNTVIIAGSSGYIGSHLVNHFASLGLWVIGIDTLPYPGEKPSGFSEEVFDILDWADLSRIAADFSPVAIFHLASSSNMYDSFEDQDSYLVAESRKTKNLLRFAGITKCDVIIMASSCSVYGNIEQGNAVESSKLSPQSPYALGKVCSERLLEQATEESPVRAAALRFFNVIGRDPASGLFERHNPESHILPLAVRAARTGGSFSVFGCDFPTPDGTAVRDYVDVRDVCRGISSALSFLQQNPKTAFRVWNLGSNYPQSVRGVLQAVEKMFDSQLQLEYVERRDGDPARAVADLSRARRELNWTADYSFEESLQTLV